MAEPYQDDGFHQIQLNGKQLVFLFMATTVVLVVIFLCGVLVGRGVKAERAAGADAAVASASETPQPAPGTAAAATAAPIGSDPRTVPEPPQAPDDLSYFGRLGKSNGTQEDLKAAPAKPGEEKKLAEDKKPAEDKTVGKAAADKAPEKDKALGKDKAPEKLVAEKALEKPAPAAASAPTPAPAPTAASPAAASDISAAAAPPSGPGFAVQIAALNVRGEADAIAKRLASKGYAAYVLAPTAGAPQVFRVRVGKFPTRREAESIATKLQKEEQFKPWITR